MKPYSGQEESTSHFWWESSRRNTRLQPSQQPRLHSVLQEHCVRSQLLVGLDIPYISSLSLSAPALALAFSSCLSPHLTSLPAATKCPQLAFSKIRVETNYTDCRRALLGCPPGLNHPYNKATSICSGTASGSIRMHHMVLGKRSRRVPSVPCT